MLEIIKEYNINFGYIKALDAFKKKFFPLVYIKDMKKRVDYMKKRFDTEKDDLLIKDLYMYLYELESVIDWDLQMGSMTESKLMKFIWRKESTVNSLCELVEAVNDLRFPIMDYIKSNPDYEWFYGYCYMKDKWRDLYV